MFHHILVPLDGSQDAEKALPMAARIARSSGAKITLSRVLSSTERFIYPDAMIVIPAKVLEDAEQEARNYLTHVSVSPLLADIQVEIELLLSDPTADALLESAQEHHVDLILLYSQGHIGVRRFVLGSIAQQLARNSRIPVLVLHKDQGSTSLEIEDVTQTFGVVVALDGSEASEAAIGPAIALSNALSAPASGFLHLMQVMTPAYNYDTSKFSTIAINQQTANAAQEAAQKYLDAVKVRIQAGEFSSSTPDVDAIVYAGEDVAETLITTVKHKNEGDERPFQAIAIATHGRHSIPRWLLGSVTEHIMDHTGVAMLIIKQQVHHSTSEHEELVAGMHQ
jgi:nucleotide-binding universal stress UspA family protein